MLQPTVIPLRNICSMNEYPGRLDGTSLNRCVEGAAGLNSPNALITHIAISSRVIGAFGQKFPDGQFSVETMPRLAISSMAAYAKLAGGTSAYRCESGVLGLNCPTALEMNTAISARVVGWPGQYIAGFGTQPTVTPRCASMQMNVPKTLSGVTSTNGVPTHWPNTCTSVTRIRPPFVGSPVVQSLLFDGSAS